MEYIKQLINALACIIKLWCTQGFEEHESNVKVARVAKESCSSILSVLQIKMIIRKRKVIFKKRKCNEMESKWEEEQKLIIKVNDTSQIE